MDKAEMLALVALKKSGTVDVSQAVAAKQAAQAAQAAAEEAQEGAEAAQAAAEAAAAAFVVDDEMDDESENPVQNKVIAGELGDLKSRMNAAQIITQAGLSPIAHITDGSANNAKSYDAQIVPQQAGSGDPSPTNVRAITGFTGANLIVRGKNIWRISHLNKTSHNGLTFAIAEDESSIVVNGTATADANVGVALKNQRIIPDGVYTYSCSSGAKMMMTKYAGGQSRWINSGASFTKAGVDFPEYAYVTFTSGSSYSNERITFQLETGTTATAFEPYQGEDYTITFPSSAGTVHGGSLHVNEDGSGTLTVDRAFETITKDGVWYGFATGTGNTSAVIQLANYQNVYYVEGSSSRNGCIASTGNEDANYWIHARQNEIPQAGDMTFAYSSTGQFRVHRTDVSTITDLDTFKANFPDTQIVYKLATPQTYTLTAPQIALLHGANNIWADTGDMAVEYIADTKLYIQTLTGHPDEDMTADANIASGSFFMVGNRLFISTSAIASGETIAPGTNCTETNLAAALNTINAD